MPRLWNEKAQIDPAIQRVLGGGLKATYRRVIGEPVPLDQIELVLALRRAERERRAEAVAPERTG